MMTKRGKTSVPADLRVLVVDDERLALDELVFLLESFPGVEVVATANNGLEAFECVVAEAPNLVFMDVNMPGLDGLAAARKIIYEAGTVPQFVFATAYDQYAVEAFNVNAVDYILKPIERARLGESIARAKKRSEMPQSINRLSQLLAHMEKLHQETPAKLLVRRGSRMLLVDAGEVIYASTRDGLIRVVSTAVEGQSNYKTIEELHSKLNSSDFWRPHRSYLVNITKIKEVVPWFKSTYQLRMSDEKQTEIPVSRAQTKRLRELFKL